MKRTFKSAFLCLSLLLAASCKNNVTETKISFQQPVDDAAFVSAVKSIDAVVLQSDSGNMIGAMPDLTLCGKDYLISDKEQGKIFRYAPDGHLLNMVGNRGNSEQEFLMLSNIQVSGESVLVFSAPDRLLNYTKEGKFLSSDKLSAFGVQAYKKDNSYLCYFGYGRGKENRLVVYGEDGNETASYLPYNSKVMSISGMNPIFSELAGGDVAFVDDWSTDIYRYSKNGVEPYLSFDFGELAIPQSFFEAEDAFAGMDKLLAAKFAMVNKYIENKDYALAEFAVVDKGKPSVFYAFRNNGKWSWFSLDTQASPRGIFYALTSDNEIIALLEPGAVLPENLLSLVSDKDVVSNGGDNYLLLKIHLK